MKKEDSIKARSIFSGVCTISSGVCFFCGAIAAGLGLLAFVVGFAADAVINSSMMNSDKTS